MIFKRQFEWAINSLKKNNEVIKEISIGKFDNFNSKYVKDESVYKLNYEDLINLNNYPCGYIPLDTPMPDYLHLK